MIRHFRAKSIRTQLKIIILGTGILFAVLCFLIFGFIREIVYLNADRNTQLSALQLSSELGFMSEKMKTFSASMCLDETIQAMLAGDVRESTAYIRDISETFIQYQILEPEIEDLSLVSDRIHYSRLYTDETLDEIRTAAGEENFDGWIGIRAHDYQADRDKNDLFVYAANVIVDGRNIGTLVISVDYVSGLLPFGENDTLHCLCEDGTVLYCFNADIEEAQSILNTRPATRPDRSGEYFWHSNAVSGISAELVTVLDTGKINTGLGRGTILIWLCFLIPVLMALLIFAVIRQSVVVPLGRFDSLIRDMRSRGQRNLRERPHFGGCQEIEHIGVEFADMLDDIHDMNEKIFDNTARIYEMEVQKKEAELEYLRSQINPHFLYNTLDMMRHMALRSGAGAVADVAMDMGRIFRFSSKGDFLVTLKEETVMTMAYIRIQQKRFEGKLQVRSFIPDELLGQTVPKMILQPLVENAIFYGIEPKGSVGTIFIGARMERNTAFTAAAQQESLIITVKDDGVGMDAMRLETIRATLADPNADLKHHVGILNTHRRIALYYGEGYGITIESREGEGTTVIIRTGAKQEG